MKQKAKPIARAEIRERMEKKFRARGAVAFHLLVVLGAGILLLYTMPELWMMRLSNTGFQDSILLYGILGTSGALHFIRYYFRHGRGRARHEQETEARIARQLRQAVAEEAEEQEELVRLQMTDKLKNRRLVLQHLVIFIGIASLFVVEHMGNMQPDQILEWAIWRDIATLFGIWGIGLAAHWLRYTFTYGLSAERREARINEQVDRELERERRRIAAIDASASGLAHIQKASETADALTLEDLEAVQERASRLPTAGSRVDG
ncbi:MAG: 2TM domain-containing protein [Chloroflexi bacterium]|nr:2TM domain-containing protein [Chloroflexota bacterium]